jgi:hypothetical protein
MIAAIFGSESSYMLRTTWSIAFVTFLCLPVAPAANPGGSAINRQQTLAAYGHLPLSFEVNRGQADQRVRFLVRGSGYSLFLTGREAVLELPPNWQTGTRNLAQNAQNGHEIKRATRRVCGSFAVWWHAAVPFALSRKRNSADGTSGRQFRRRGQRHRRVAGPEQLFHRQRSEAVA